MENETMYFRERPTYFKRIAIQSSGTWERLEAVSIVCYLVMDACSSPGTIDWSIFCEELLCHRLTGEDDHSSGRGTFFLGDLNPHTPQLSWAAYRTVSGTLYFPSRSPHPDKFRSSNIRHFFFPHHRLSIYSLSLVFLSPSFPFSFRRLPPSFSSFNPALQQNGYITIIIKSLTNTPSKKVLSFLLLQVERKNPPHPAFYC